MPARVVRLFPEAEAGLVASERFYARRGVTAAAAFLTEVDHALNRIAEAPQTWPAWRVGGRSSGERGGDRLHEWTEMAKRGEMPGFGANLVY